MLFQQDPRFALQITLRSGSYVLRASPDHTVVCHRHDPATVVHLTGRLLPLARDKMHKFKDYAKRGTVEPPQSGAVRDEILDQSAVREFSLGGIVICHSGGADGERVRQTMLDP